jgi:uronate dehydrogenase
VTEATETTGHGTKNGRVLITGAAGGVGTFLRNGFVDLGWSVRGYDVVTPDDPGAVEWVLGDVTDPDTLAKAMDDVDAVIHLAGIPVEDHFGKLLKTNIDGTYQVFETARRTGVPRVVYASSNHAVGYHERADFPDGIGVDVRTRPDTYYGVTKVFGEAIGSFYADRHGIGVACVRIGSCFAKPTTVRHLETWLSPADAVRLFHTLVTAPALRYEIVYGVSANTRAWMDLGPARRLGYEPQDDAEVYAEEVVAACGPLDPEDPDYLYLGGRFTTHTPPA